MKIFNHDNCNKEKQEILKTFENTILKVLESVEKMNNKFIDMASRIEMEHFKQSEKQTARLMARMEKQNDKILDLTKKEVPISLGGVDIEKIENTIEKEDAPEPFLDEMPPMSMEGVKIQLEGQEEIFPVDIHK